MDLSDHTVYIDHTVYRPEDVLMGRCYERTRAHGDVYEGIGRVVAGPVTFYPARDGWAVAPDEEILHLVSCQSCQDEIELPYLDEGVARQHALAWAHQHRCPEGDDVR